MTKLFRLFILVLALPAVLLLAGCSGTGSTHASVYAGYGYPHYRYGYNDCCYGSPDRPDRPDKPDRPVNLPAKPDRPNMGQPSRSQMSRPARASRGGGRR